MVSLQYVFACGFLMCHSVKMLIHTLHKKMVSHQCVFAGGFFNVEWCENADPHTAQENGFSPVCVRMCLFKLERFENADPHTSQENGFSPVCVRVCLFKFICCENADAQISHENSFSPVCVSMFFQIRPVWKWWSTLFTKKWFLSSVRSQLFFQNADAHTRKRFLSTVWLHVWVSNMYVMKVMIYLSQENGFSPMYFHMSFQSGISWKCWSAHSARKWFLSNFFWLVC